MSCDKYRTLTDHMIYKYEQLWPDHPFHFRVPYQELAATISTDKVEYKKTSPGIKATVLTLLDDLDDEELIYWCIDDKYPIKLNVPRIETIYSWLGKGEASSFSGVLFCRCRTSWHSNSLTGEQAIDSSGNVYLERKWYSHIWIHQFLRVKVLRHIFRTFPDEIHYAKFMDYFLQEVIKPESQRLLVTRQNLATFGESTFHGRLTQNCYKSLLNNDFALPEWSRRVLKKSIFMGKRSETVRGWASYNVAKLIKRFT